MSKLLVRTHIRMQKKPHSPVSWLRGVGCLGARIGPPPRAQEKNNQQPKSQEASKSHIPEEVIGSRPFLASFFFSTAKTRSKFDQFLRRKNPVLMMGSPGSVAKYTFYKTRPDISCAVSLAAQCLWHNLQDLKVRIKHLLQYLSTTRTFGLLYLHPQNSTQSSSLTEFAVFSDASFAPSGKGSQSGYCVMLTYGTVRHLVHWHSAREKKVAESSAESELWLGETLGF